MDTLEIKNDFYWRRYLTLISRWKKKNFIEGEMHHIIPKCVGGTNDNENLVFLGYREHYIAHYILAKALDYDKLWFAFNMMRRVCNGKSVLYEAARKYVSRVISDSNTGRVASEELRKTMSANTKNTVIVKDKKGNMFRVSCDDPKYLSGEYVFYRTGFTHKEETIKKMRKNGLRNRRIYYNVYTGKNRYFKDNEKIPSDFKLGAGPLFKERSKEIMKNTGKWYYNEKLNKHKRLRDDQNIPDGYVLGRKQKRDNLGRFI